MIRPGQHVSVDGRIYHPYLRDWTGRQSSTIADFLRILQDVFAREPPLVARQPQQQYRQPASASPAQRPLPPPKERPRDVVVNPQPVEMAVPPNPPPKPPKPGEASRVHTLLPDQNPKTHRDGPPLPPLPHERPQQRHQSPWQIHQTGSYAAPPGPQSIYASASNGPPPVPLHPRAGHGEELQQPPRDSPVSPVSANGFSQDTRYSHAPPLPLSPMQSVNGQQHFQASDPVGQNHSQGVLPQQQMPAHHHHHAQSSPRQYQQQQQQQRPSQVQPQSMPQVHQQPYHQQQQHQQPHHQPQHQPQRYHAHQGVSAAIPAPPLPPPDLLTDPFDIMLPATTSLMAAPPIPPNPERELLLRLLSQSLVSQTHQTLTQNASFLPALHAQNQALQEATQHLHFELAQLEQMDRTLANNESILRQSILDCEAVIVSSKDMPDPPIDEVLVAPTLVQNQLWTLEGEIAGLKEALWVLQRAVGQGRVGGQEFVKVNRALGRELFFKMALGSKIARGLGLDQGHSNGRAGDDAGAGRAGDEGFYT